MLPPVNRPCEDWAWRLVTIPRLFDVIVNYKYIPLYNIVSDIIAYVVICVDFLGTHMASLVLFFKTGCDNYSYSGM